MMMSTALSVASCATPFRAFTASPISATHSAVAGTSNQPPPTAQLNGSL